MPPLAAATSNQLVGTPKKKRKKLKKKTDRLSLTEVGRHHLSHMCAHKFSATCGMTNTHTDAHTHALRGAKITHKKYTFMICRKLL